MLLVDVPWAGRLLALPFLTALAPSERFYENKPRSHKTLLDWARQMVLQIHRWLPDRKIVIVADSAFAAIDFLAAVRKHVAVITRLRLDAALFDFPEPKPKGRGRPAVKGKRLPSLTQILQDPTTIWQRQTVSFWYGKTNRALEIANGTALWYHGGTPPIPIRWILVRDLKKPNEPQAFLCTDTQAETLDILGWFISRWQVEVTFEETRAHLGVETQRQWSDLAILSSTLSILPGVGDRVCDAFPGLAGNNDCVGRGPGHEENLMVPDFASDGCDGVAEGESALWIPGCRFGRDVSELRDVLHPETDD
jgi:hypothetical protein